MADSTTPGNVDLKNYPGFKRYWDHYEAMQTWIKEYTRSWETEVNVRHDSFHPSEASSFSSSMPPYSSQYRSSPYSTGQRRHSFSRPRKISKTTENQKQSYSPSCTQRSAASESEAGMEEDNEVIVFEISEEMKTFFQMSQKHKEEREKEKERLADTDKDGLGEDKQDQFKAPTERPGSKRNSEMKILYGKHAPAIQGLETAIQMEFDHILDKRQPQLWPSIALNL